MMSSTFFQYRIWELWCSVNTVITTPCVSTRKCSIICGLVITVYTKLHRIYIEIRTATSPEDVIISVMYKLTKVEIFLLNLMFVYVNNTAILFQNILMPNIKNCNCRYSCTRRHSLCELEQPRLSLRPKVGHGSFGALDPFYPLLHDP